MSDTKDTDDVADDATDDAADAATDDAADDAAEARSRAMRPSLELLWGTGERPARGPKRGLSLESVVDAAVKVADAEGLDTLSMRRLASELGTGTMSLYRYVPGKTELLDLMLDRIQGEQTESHNPAEQADWRGAVTSIARGTLDLHRAHPWLLKINQSRVLLGPRTLRSLELSVTGLRGMTGFSDSELLSVIIAVQSFATGIARLEVETTQAAEETGLDQEAFWAAQQPYLERAMLSGDYPVMTGLSEDTFSEGFDHFAFGLERLIAGFAALVAEREARGE